MIARYIFLSVLLALTTAHAEETEIFRAPMPDTGGRPKVLIIFDNSGSMSGTISIPRPAYDPNTTYPTVSGIQNGRLYWSADGRVPSPSTSNWIPAERNRCASSYSVLSETGFYTSNWGRWLSNRNTWQPGLGNSNLVHVDCSTDIINLNPGNGTGTGSPGNGYPTNNRTTRPYRSNADTSIIADWRSSAATVFTANYMNWYHNPSLQPTTKTKLQIAKETVTTIVSSNPNIDFGLATFNINSGDSEDSNNGGRIAKRIISDMSTSERNDLITTINSLTASTNTPLCEATYEVFRYLTGQSPLWGNSTNPTAPTKDSAAQSGGKYVSPLSACQNVYVVLVTDGMPYRDRAANTLIESLTGKTCRDWPADGGKGTVKNCLPELAEYMYNRDLDNNSTNGQQRAIMYTIGFTTAQSLLQETATKGGGQYYTADTADQLAEAFQGVILDILSRTSSFVSPTVSVKALNRAESRDEAFFALFQPDQSNDWKGNLKKFKTSYSNGTTILVDRNGRAAYDAATDTISNRAVSFWTNIEDGYAVDKGGAGEKLLNRDPDTRTIYTNTGTNGALQTFDATHLTRQAFGLPSDQALYDLFGVTNSNDFLDLLAWARGWTDRNKTSRKDWILGDIIHSQPVVLDYGARSGFTATQPDMRIVVGTNAGFLHMFRNATSAGSADGGDEVWAFFPKELAAILNQRRNNLLDGRNVWGVDGRIAVHRYDAPEDGKPLGSGIIGDNSADRMWIFFGLRRGGQSIYAIDVTNPDSPKFLWTVSDKTTGFELLGQTWSTPIITYIPGYTDAGGRLKPVVIFGGGYDPEYDNTSTVATDVIGAKGRAIFIVDAQTGALIWSTTSLASGIDHSIAADVTVLDINGDTVADIVYAPDVAGQVWRLDLNGSDRTQWRLSKFASLGGTTAADDRRFFHAIAVARAIDPEQRPYHALAIGSGDRTNPNATNNQDRLYVLKDYYISPITTAAPTSSECSTRPSPDVRCTWPLRHQDLFDATSNIIQTGTNAQRDAALATLATKSGWYINLTNTGEKTFDKALILKGATVFVTYTPASQNDAGASICEPPIGISRIYVLSVTNATAVWDLNKDNSVTTADRSRVYGTGILAAPSVIVDQAGKVSLLTPTGNVNQTLADIKMRRPTYWFHREF